MIEAICKGAPQAKPYLTDTQPLRTNDTHITIGIDPEFAAEKASLESQHTLQFIKKKVTDFLHRPIAIDFEILPPKAEAIPLATEPTTRCNKSFDKKHYYDNPAVRCVLETFSGDIEQIR